MVSISFIFCECKSKMSELKEKNITSHYEEDTNVTIKLRFIKSSQRVVINTLYFSLSSLIFSCISFFKSPFSVNLIK